MKRIILFYASYGGGHLSAAKNLKEYIEANYTDCDVFLFFIQNQLLYNSFYCRVVFKSLYLYIL